MISKKDDLFNKLEKALSSKLPSQPQNVKDAIKEFIDKMKNDKIQVFTPESLSASFSYEGVVSLEYFICPACRNIYHLSEVDKDFKCKNCGEHLIPAYVGVPINDGSKGSVIHISSSPSPGSKGNYFILPVDKLRNVRCHKKESKRLKGLKPENPTRPIYTLRFTCPYKDDKCEFYYNGYCTFGNGNDKERGGKVFFQKKEGYKIVIDRPNESVTKAYTEVIFYKSSFQKESISDIDAELTKLFNEYAKEETGDRIFNKIELGEFEVKSITPFYLVGPSTSPRRNRSVFMINAEDNFLRVAGRSMRTTGLLFSLNYDRIKKVINKLSTLKITVDSYVVAHSVSHVMLKSIIMLTGLSPTEFGEAIFVTDKGENVAEVLIYDDSPGGLGGVKTIEDSPLDFWEYVKKSASPCPRACRRACRACLYLENCSSMNFSLNWYASYLYLRGRFQ